MLSLSIWRDLGNLAPTAGYFALTVTMAVTAVSRPSRPDARPLSRSFAFSCRGDAESHRDQCPGLQFGLQFAPVRCSSREYAHTI
jgi:hypothetical protein